MENIDLLKYPQGRFEYSKTYSSADTRQHIAVITEFPKKLSALAVSLTPEQLEKSYRPGGWNAKQIINHLADSHMNALIRLKLTLTENKPTIKPYDQDGWANLEDGKNTPVAVSLSLIDGIHQKLSLILNTLSETDFQKVYIHPEYNKEFKLEEMIALYAWHGRQHYEHLKIIKNL
ncbi:MAG: putative metal-dependent hydrolase [Bacteroidetes bacterium]|nr:putative metal-dependent hydrolase [Bacteroidota bacterium]